MDRFNHIDFKEVWALLGNTPVTEEGDCIDEDFLDYPKGTDLYDIWHDIEYHYDMSIGDYLNNGED